MKKSKKIIAYILLCIPALLWVFLTIFCILLEHFAEFIYWLLNKIEKALDSIHY